MKTFIACILGILLFGSTIIASNSTSNLDINLNNVTVHNENVILLTDLTFDGFEGGTYFFTRNDGSAFTINTAYLIPTLDRELNNELAIGRVFTCTISKNATTSMSSINGEHVIEISRVTSPK